MGKVLYTVKEKCFCVCSILIRLLYLAFSANSCWGDEIDLFKNCLCSTFYIVNACAQAAFLVGDVMLLTMAFKKVKRNGRKPAVQNLVYVCNINFMFMLCLCLVYEATSCVKKQKSFCACVYDVRIVQYDWWNNRSQALFKTMDHRSRLPNKFMPTLDAHWHGNRYDGPVVRASASQSEGRGFESRPSHTKDFKNGTRCLLFWRLINEKRVGKLNMRSYQWTSPPPRCSFHCIRRRVA